MNEAPLGGGRVTPGVVRVGETVRRPPRENSRFVGELLEHLEAHGFDAAPRYLGTDERGREMFSFLSGDVPADLDPAIPDEALVAAARLIRGFHDATAGTTLAADQQVVCHHDLSPCNFVFRSGLPVGIIDFDAAAPGERREDVGMGLFLWLNLGTDGPEVAEQARRINLFCRAYGIEPAQEVIKAIMDAVRANVEQLRAESRTVNADWWQEQLDWLTQQQEELAQTLRA
jgi:aminoglycoside phosphotransferase (APT) family kinase protein